MTISDTGTSLRGPHLPSSPSSTNGARPLLVVIIASTRPGRAGLPIGRWFVEHATAHGGFDVEVADLVEVALPLLDEPEHPRLGMYRNDHTKAWSAVIGRCHAVVIVTPEYNHGYPASVKNALDYLHDEWRDKAIGFVSYGGVAGGSRAVEQLRQVVTTLRMVAVVETVSIPNFPQLMEGGTLQPHQWMKQAADQMLDEMRRIGVLLRTPEPTQQA